MLAVQQGRLLAVAPLRLVLCFSSSALMAAGVVAVVQVGNLLLVGPRERLAMLRTTDTAAVRGATTAEAAQQSGSL